MYLKKLEEVKPISPTKVDPCWFEKRMREAGR